MLKEAFDKLEDPMKVQKMPSIWDGTKRRVSFAIFDIVWREMSPKHLHRHHMDIFPEKKTQSMK